MYLFSIPANVYHFKGFELQRDTVNCDPHNSIVIIRFKMCCIYFIECMWNMEHLCRRLGDLVEEVFMPSDVQMHS